MTQHDAEIHIDFDGAAATRAEILQALRGQVDDDVLLALQQPGTPDWLLAQPFQVIERLEELQGPDEGSGESLPLRWRTPARDDDKTHEDLADVYRQVLMHGSTDDQRAVLAAGQLIAQWEAVRSGIPAPLAHVWQQRFPELDPIRW
ncbi:hypothetical protein [Streptomyces sp. NPDC059816]|uniref:hypothetical protein n=1 Tax=Streptomyces sp. NPDC059816 TaxID=3346960 RepID=UPI003645F9CA